MNYADLLSLRLDQHGASDSSSAKDKDADKEEGGEHASKYFASGGGGGGGGDGSGDPCLGSKRDIERAPRPLSFGGSPCSRVLRNGLDDNRRGGGGGGCGGSGNVGDKRSSIVPLETMGRGQRSGDCEPSLPSAAGSCNNTEKRAAVNGLKTKKGGEKKNKVTKGNKKRPRVAQSSGEPLTCDVGEFAIFPTPRASPVPFLVGKILRKRLLAFPETGGPARTEILVHWFTPKKATAVSPSGGSGTVAAGHAVDRAASHPGGGRGAPSRSSASGCITTSQSASAEVAAAAVAAAASVTKYASGGWSGVLLQDPVNKRLVRDTGVEDLAAAMMVFPKLLQSKSSLPATVRDAVSDAVVAAAVNEKRKSMKAMATGERARVEKTAVDAVLQDMKTAGMGAGGGVEKAAVDAAGLKNMQAAGTSVANIVETVAVGADLKDIKAGETEVGKGEEKTAVDAELKDMKAAETGGGGIAEKASVDADLKDMKTAETGVAKEEGKKEGAMPAGWFAVQSAGEEDDSGAWSTGDSSDDFE